MRSPLRSHLTAVYEEARQQILDDGVIHADTGIRLIAEGLDPDAVAAQLTRELENEQ